MRRRRYLALLAATLAGCGSDPETDTPQPTPTGTPTATATPTASPSPSPTPTPETTLALGETFATPVGLKYTVRDVEVLGTDHRRATDGKILHVIAGVANESDETQSATHPDSIYLTTADEQVAYNQYSSYWDATREILPGKTASGYVEYEIPVEMDMSDIEAVVAVLEAGPTVTWTV